MNNIKKLFYVLSAFAVCFYQLGCSNGGSSASRSLAASVYYPSTLSGANVVPMSVGACGVNGYENEPCISVTICTPGTSTCQTIDNILVDTGSYGLKIFKSLISVPLTQITLTGGAGLANCTSYLDGSGHWGPVVRADIKLGGVTASNVPMVTLDSTYAQASKCSSKPDATPADAGFNGIIGVGSFVEDCSVNSAGNNPCETLDSSGQIPKTYFVCTSGVCAKTLVAASNQIANPVAKMPSPYNNGLVIKLPSVSSSGAGAAYGYMLLGIGVSGVSGSLDTPASAATAYTLVNDGTFTTTYRGQSISYAFVDSGTNFYGFPQIGGAPTLCTGSSSDFYCPTSQLSLSATVTSAASVSATVPFYIGNMVSLASQDPYSMVYNNIGFTISSTFDWGLPFFLGRTVFIGIKGSSATVGGSSVSGPFVAW